ncbi:MAG TPA: DNA alkylation repair protein [Steroidobacteraceae bacterium]|jgi:3-methyladenine DNA glycosylase AlkD|nr:DNA alkylation repair protein [Steroidobacteraceae bacterium]
MSDPRVAEALDWLRKHSSKAVRAGMARYAIPADHALGVRMGDIQRLGRQLGRDHALALALWKTGVYEARMLAAYVDEPERVTAAQMDAQARDFDNWAVCDTLCFALWVRTPHAFAKVRKWAAQRAEFVRRAAFALLASLALKDADAGDAQFMRALALIEKAAADERNFVKKAVNWALRAIGGRNVALNRAALQVAERLAECEAPGPRWIGKDALRQLRSAPVQRRLRKSQASAQSG